MKQITRRSFMAGTAAVAAASILSGCGGSSADTSEKAAWPTGDVTIYVPAGAGGSSDTITRQFAERMKKITGANFVIVNDTTGANSVAYETVRNAKPDGLTLMGYHGGMCIQYASGQYDHSLDEFTVVANLTSSDIIGYGVWVNGKSDFNSFDDLIAYAKANPGKLTVGVETNNIDHLLASMIQKEYGVEFTIVSAGSNAEKLPLLMGGNLDVCLFSPSGVSDYHTSGDLKCLVLMGDEHTDLLPGVPTFTDEGKGTMLLPLFFFLAGPAGIPDDVCNAIDEVIAQISEDETIYDVMDTYAMNWTYTSLADAQSAAHEMQQSYVDAYALL